MARNQENEYRDPVTKRYAYHGGDDRLCKCGHRLGFHVAGGFECGTTSETKGCTCAKFRPSGKRQPDSSPLMVRHIIDGREVLLPSDAILRPKLTTTDEVNLSEPLSGTY